MKKKKITNIHINFLNQILKN